MPRQFRLDTPETLHQVMIRGIEGELIFGDNREGWDAGSKATSPVVI
jgi:hypothetical protein